MQPWVGRLRPPRGVTGEHLPGGVLTTADEVWLAMEVAGDARRDVFVVRPDHLGDPGQVVNPDDAVSEFTVGDVDGVPGADVVVGWHPWALDGTMVTTWTNAWVQDHLVGPALGVSIPPLLADLAGDGLPEVVTTAFPS